MCVDSVVETPSPTATFSLIPSFSVSSSHRTQILASFVVSSMALFEEISDTKKKRKKECNRKLLVGVKVEVRDLLAGSWKSGIVTGEGYLMRCVKLDNIYLKYSTTSRNLIRDVPVSTMIEGDIPAFGMPKTYRGLIRPPPPMVCFPSILNYGLCMDVYLEDTWWEGVIFDYGDDYSEEKLIFFPDSDIELRVGHYRTEGS